MAKKSLSNFLDSDKVSPLVKTCIYYNCGQLHMAYQTIARVFPDLSGQDKFFEIDFYCRMLIKIYKQWDDLENCMLSTKKALDKLGHSIEMITYFLCYGVDIMVYFKKYEEAKGFLLIIGLDLEMKRMPKFIVSKYYRVSITYYFSIKDYDQAEKFSKFYDEINGHEYPLESVFDKIRKKESGDIMTLKNIFKESRLSLEDNEYYELAKLNYRENPYEIVKQAEILYELSDGVSLNFIVFLDRYLKKDLFYNKSSEGLGTYQITNELCSLDDKIAIIHIIGFIDLRGVFCYLDKDYTYCSIYDLNDLKEEVNVALKLFKAKKIKDYSNVWQHQRELANKVLTDDWKSYFDGDIRYKKHAHNIDLIDYFVHLIKEEEKSPYDNFFVDKLTQKLLDSIVGDNRTKRNILKKKELVIITEGNANIIPVENIGDGFGGILLDRLTVSYTPSLSYYLINSVCLKYHEPKYDNIQLFGVVDYSINYDENTGYQWSNLNMPKRIFSKLKNIGVEVDEDHGLRARKENVLLSLKDDKFKIYHFATHGLFLPEIEDATAIVLSNNTASNNPNDQYLFCSEVRGLEMSADLVVLSACNSMNGKHVVTEGIVGVAQAFLIAGADSVISARWEVDDDATGIFFAKYYEILFSKKISYKEALTKTKRFFKQDTEMKEKGYNHPYYWAAFKYEGA